MLGQSGEIKEANFVGKRVSEVSWTSEQFGFQPPNHAGQIRDHSVSKFTTYVPY
jgi:hypothetical protein